MIGKTSFNRMGCFARFVFERRKVFELMASIPPWVEAMVMNFSSDLGP